MADHYSILGLTKNATDVEIKTAFRKLAKIYHPDKNPDDPNAKSRFEHVLKAYNILINPHSRKRYDHSSIAHQAPKNNQQRQRNKGQKEWTFTEEDLKRREYYKKHYQQAKHKTESSAPQKATYNDYKYVLFATPIAVGLLMLIISMFNNEPKTENRIQKQEKIIETKKPETNLINGATPYSGYFGNIKTSDTENRLQINNLSGCDAVITVFNKKTNAYLQHAYVQNTSLVEFKFLPNDGVYWKCMIGKNWDAEKLLLNNTVIGGFDSIAQYQNRQADPLLFKNNNIDEISLLYILDPETKSKKFISTDSVFFKKQ